MDKFLQENSPIDRYYRLYVIEERARALKEVMKSNRSSRLGSPSSKLHSQERAVARYLQTMPPVGERLAELAKGVPQSEDRYKKVVAQLNEQQTLEDAFKFSQHESDAKSIMKLHAIRCNCHAVQNKLTEKRLSCAHGSGEERAGGVFPDYTLKEVTETSESAMLKGRHAKRAYEKAMRLQRRHGLCRRGCSTIHNPEFHMTRFGMKVEKARPKSARKPSPPPTAKELKKI